MRLFNEPQPDLDLFLMGNLVTSDQPHHRKLRQAINRVFTPRAVNGLADRIARITRSLLDDAAGSDTFDRMSTVAYPSPPRSPRGTDPLMLDAVGRSRRLRPTAAASRVWACANGSSS